MPVMKLPVCNSSVINI